MIKNMKHRIKPVMARLVAPIACVAIAGTTLLTSCDDFLNVESRDEILLENFWNEKADVEAILAGCYSRLQDENTVKRMIIWGEVRSDNLVAGDLQNNDNNLENVLKENINALNAYTTWTDFYDVINRCNTLIEYAPKVAANDPSYTDSELQSHLAEVRTLRALCYFYLIRTFYAVPYSTTAYIHDAQKMDIEASSFDDVLNYLIEDLRDISDNERAQKYYPETKPTYQTGRITLDAVNALLCELYLWKQDYQNCVVYADKVINSKKARAEELWRQSPSQAPSQALQNRYNGFPLSSGQMTSGGSSLYDAGYNSLFVEGNDLETIFELSYSNNAVVNSMIRNDAVALLYGNVTNKGYLAPSTYVSDDVSSATYSVYESANQKLDARSYINCISGTSAQVNKLRASIITVDASKPSDPKTTVGISGTWSQNGTWNMRSQNTNNWIIYRLSDIMLLKAEALVQMMTDETNNATNDNLREQAFYLVNAVNKRALAQATTELKDTLKPVNFATKNAMEQLVLRERQRELMFEGKRWYDLVRMSLRKGNANDLASIVTKKVKTNSASIRNFFTSAGTFPYVLFWPYNYDEEYNVNINLQKTHNPAYSDGKGKSSTAN